MSSIGQSGFDSGDDLISKVPQNKLTSSLQLSVEMNNISLMPGNPMDEVVIATTATLIFIRT